MDPTSCFFSKLRKLATTLETDTARLQHAYQNRENDIDNTNRRAMQTYHELNLEVMDLKYQVRVQLAQQRVKEQGVSRFLKACKVMMQKCDEDVERLKRHCEMYGYQDPPKAHRPTKVSCQEATDRAGVEEDYFWEAGGKVETEQEDGETSLKLMLPAPKMDPLRTPQLSDFGLSESHLKRVLSRTQFTPKVTPKPGLNLSPSSVYMPLQPTIHVTPKLKLHMDKDELQTPQMHDFGISEDFMSLNNDFTMALYHMNHDKAKRVTSKATDTGVTPGQFSQDQGQERVQSRQLPLSQLWTSSCPSIKISKSQDHSPPPPPLGEANLGSPDCPSDLQTTPEVSQFQTPCINRLLSSRKILAKTPLKKPVPTIQRYMPSGKENRLPSLSVVSKSEFQSLPRYLQQVSLHHLNQAVHKINDAAAENCYGEATELWMEDLRKITGMGTKAPIYFLCLTELKRLEYVKGTGNNSLYKLTSHNGRTPGK